ncbi:MAG TPA: FAD-dependent oxidoreductase [Bacillota bacterium]|nr:FAD-dependent oxidoreductase [Bacillota bacterium]
MDVKKYVIIGNGTAAIGCIEGIRSVDATGKITVISSENRHVYCRPLISYLLEGKTDTEKMKYRPDDFYEKNDCNVLYGKRAISLNSEDKTVAMDDGETLSFDSLCVASGSSPFVPPMEGMDKVEKRFSFMTLDDALSLEKAITPDSRVLIIGAGLIGLKCAEGISGKVGSITVCDLAERVLSSILDNECAAVVQKHLETHGITFMLGNSVSKFDDETAYMKNGENIHFDILVTAVGVRPNIALIKEAGGACGRAITVSEKMKTSYDDIYAAGDCTESVDVSSGSVKVMALMPNAYMQGHCAGVNMAGGESVFDNAIPMNSIGFFGVHIMSAGSHTDDSEIYEETKDGSVKKLFMKDGMLTGFVLIGDVDKAGIYTDMIRSRKSISEIDFDMLKKKPSLYAFDEEYRGKILGGVG